MKIQKPATQKTKKIVTAQKPVAKKPVVAKKVATKKVSKKVARVVIPVVAKPAAKKTRGFIVTAREKSKRQRRTDAAKTRRARRVVTPSVEQPVEKIASVASAQVVDLVTARDNLIASLAGPRGCGKVPVEFCRKNHDLAVTFYRHDRDGFPIIGSNRRICGTDVFVADQLFHLLDGEEQENRANRSGRRARRENEQDGFGIARTGKKRARRQLSEHDARLNDRARARALKEQDRAVLLGAVAPPPKKPVFTGKSGFRPKSDPGAEKVAAFRPARKNVNGNGNGNGAGVIKLADPVPVNAAPKPIVAPAPKPVAPPAKPEAPRVELKKYEHAATHCACCGGTLVLRAVGKTDFHFRMFTYKIHPALPSFINGEGAENGDRNIARRLCEQCGKMIYRASEKETVDQLCMLVKMVNSRGNEVAKALLLAIAENHRADFALAFAKAKVMSPPRN